MRQKSETTKVSSERVVKDIRRATRKQYSAEEKIRIVLDGLRGEHSVAELCRREGIAEKSAPSTEKISLCRKDVPLRPKMQCYVSSRVRLNKGKATPGGSRGGKGLTQG